METFFFGSAARPPSSRLEPCTVDPATGGNIQSRPRKLRDSEPVYPEPLRADKVAGEVVLEGVVGREGTVHDLRVVEAPQPDLRKAAVDAVSRWLFDPTLLGCDPVEVTMKVNLRF